MRFCKILHDITAGTAFYGVDHCGSEIDRGTLARQRRPADPGMSTGVKNTPGMTSEHIVA